MEVRNKRWDEAYFRDYLRRILSLYPTGREVDLDEVADYHRRVIGQRNIPEAYRKAKAEGRILLQPRFGVATVEGQIEGMRYLQEEGGADLLTMSCDTYTRRLEFDKAERAIEESIKEGRSMLNGFPAVIHGVQATRRVVESVGRPVGGRGATGTPQLYNTIMLAGGATEFNGSALAFCLCVEARQPIPEAIHNTQFVDRLIGWLNERGVQVGKESSTIVSGTIVPPSIAVVCGVIEVVLAAEQGVRYHCVAYPLNGAIIQDQAAIRVMREFCDRYTRELGYRDIEISYAVHQWLGPFPEEKDRAMARIAFDTVIACYAGVDKILVKSSEEGLGTPTNQGNAEGLRVTRQVIELMKGQEFPPSEELEEEAEIIRREAKAILEAVLELGKGDVALGVVKAFETGAYEFPYSVNQHNAGRMLICRDHTGAVRYLDMGNLPFDRTIKEYHQRKLARRRRTVKDDYELVIEDIRAAIR